MQGEQLISLLVLLSKSDKQFDDFEFSYILQVGHAIGLNQMQIENAIRTNSSKAPEFPKSEQERMSVLYYMLFLMKIDKSVDEKEIELIHHYGFKLGFSKVMIDDFVAVISEHAEDRVPTEKMIAIIKKYQN